MILLFLRITFISPGGCFVADWQGDVGGVLATTTYDELAFLGAVIVRPELRGKGVGKTMMEVALRHLSSEGVRTVRLYAYLNAVRFYERLGFHGEYEVVRWIGSRPVGPMRSVRPVRIDDLDTPARMDGPYVGGGRR